MNTQELHDELISKNIIIAEFWGYKFYPADKWYNLKGYLDHYWIENKDKSIQRLTPKKFRFNWDWNWLLPVINKITKLDLLNEPSYNHELIRAHANFCIKIKEIVVKDELDEAYDLVVNFINEYNKK